MSEEDTTQVLIIGGRGLIGSHLADRLAERPGIKVSVLSRKNFPKRNDRSIDYLVGDLLDLHSLVDAIAGKHVIIQCAQFPGHPVERPWLGDAYTYEGLDGSGTENLAKAIELSSRKQQLKYLVYFSGAGAGKGGDYPWFRAKERAEKAITNTGIPYTIIRPSWIYGKGDRSMSKFVLLAKYAPVFPLIGDGKNTINPIWVEDVAAITTELIERATKHELSLEEYRLLYLGGPPVTMRTVATTVMKLLGKDKPLLPQPSPLLKLGGTFAQFIPGSPLSPGSVDFLTKGEALENPSESVLGVKIKSLTEGLKASGLV